MEREPEASAQGQEITTAQAAAEARVTSRQVTKWCKQGLVKCRLLNPRLYLIDVESFREYHWSRKPAGNPNFRPRTADPAPYSGEL